MKKYAKLIIALGLAGGIMLTGCQKNESGSAEPTATPEPTEAAEEVTPEPTAMAAEEPEPTEDPIPDGYVVSYPAHEAASSPESRCRPAHPHPGHIHVYTRIHRALPVVLLR